MEVTEKVMEFCGYIQEVYEKRKNPISSSVFTLITAPICFAHYIAYIIPDLVNASQILGSLEPSTQKLF